ncbi:MAG: HAD family phosphatase [Pseudomonadota bacterium]
MELRLFDLGGTLVDSVWSKREAFVRFARLKGVALPEEELRRRLAEFPVARVRTGALIAWLGELGAYQAAPGDRELFRDIEQSLQMHVVPGAIEYLGALREAGIQVGLVTNAGSAWLTNTVGRTPLGSFFCADNIFGREDTEPKKPAPTAYLKALARFRPDLCVAYEDTPRGIEAARAAQVDLILGMATSEHHDPGSLLEAGADAVFRDYREVPLHPWQGAGVDGGASRKSETA